MIPLIAGAIFIFTLDDSDSKKTRAYWKSLNGAISGKVIHSEKVHEKLADWQIIVLDLNSAADYCTKNSSYFITSSNKKAIIIDNGFDLDNDQGIYLTNDSISITFKPYKLTKSRQGAENLVKTKSLLLHKNFPKKRLEALKDSLKICN